MSDGTAPTPEAATTEYAVKCESRREIVEEFFTLNEARNYIDWSTDMPCGPHRVVFRMVTPWEPLPDEREAHEDA